MLGDGRKLIEKTITDTNASEEIDLGVQGVMTLTLVLKPGPGFEIGDYGNWADARLLR